MADEDQVVTRGVVVGVDGSEPNIPAVRWAAHAAAAHRLPLTLMHARPDVAGVLREVLDDSPILTAAAEVARERHPDLTVVGVESPDPPVQSLLKASETADFVVLGSRGLEGFMGLLVGSTTMHVAPYAQCPVVVVHPEYAETNGGPHAGDVVLGYDGSSAANRASAFAFRHAQAVGCSVVVVSVESRRGEPEVHDMSPDAAMPGSDTGAFYSPLLVTALSFESVPTRFVGGSGRPSAVLTQESIGCELLVVGTRGLGGFAELVMGSVSQKVLAYAKCPVAILHSRIPAKAAAGIET